MLVESGFRLKRSPTLAAVKGRERLSLNRSPRSLDTMHFVDQMLSECVLICEISVVVTAMELTDVASPTGDAEDGVLTRIAGHVPRIFGAVSKTRYSGISDHTASCCASSS